MEQLLALEMVRVTEAAAIAVGPVHGPRRPDGADRAATEAMRRTMDEIEIAGTIVIGEGERDEAPMLYIGEQVGRRTPPAGDDGRVAIDIAVDPLEGTNLVAHGQANAITVLAASEKGGLVHAPDTYLEKLCVGPVAAGRVDIRLPPRENLARIATALGRSVGDITVVILERPRHEALIAEVRVGRRPDQADQRRRPLGRDHVRRPGHRRPRGHGHRRRAGGRASRPRPCAASAARSRPGSASATTRSAQRGAAMGHGDEDRVYHTEDLASGEHLVFAATGVTDRRPARGRPLLRRRRAHPLARDGLPDQAGPLRRHGPHVRPGPAAGRPPADRSQVTARRTIVAMGGGGFQMEPENHLLDDHVLALARDDRSR